jgi:hypothetical protein
VAPTISQLVDDGVLDADLAGMLWLLRDGGLPRVIGGRPGSGRHALAGALDEVSAAWAPASSATTTRSSRSSRTRSSPARTSSCLGERGQAKSRIWRRPHGLLDEWTPIVAGTEISENPFAPISAARPEIVAEHGDDTRPSSGCTADERYARSWPRRTSPSPT